jgi:hypothetical protein
MNLDNTGLLTVNGNVQASTNEASVGTHPSYSGYSAFWRNGSDYSVLANATDTLVNSSSTSGALRLRKGNAERIVLTGNNIEMHGPVVQAGCSNGWALQYNICRSSFYSARRWDDAQLYCHNLGAHICRYSEIYIITQASSSIYPWQNGDWIGDYVGDDTALCVNNTLRSNFDGTCSRNDLREFRCCISQTF